MNYEFHDQHEVHEDTRETWATPWTEAQRERLIATTTAPPGRALYVAGDPTGGLSHLYVRRPRSPAEVDAFMEHLCIGPGWGEGPHDVTVSMGTIEEGAFENMREHDGW